MSKKIDDADRYLKGCIAEAFNITMGSSEMSKFVQTTKKREREKQQETAKAIFEDVEKFRYYIKEPVWDEETETLEFVLTDEWKELKRKYGVEQ